MLVSLIIPGVIAIFSVLLWYSTRENTVIAKKEQERKDTPNVNIGLYKKNDRIYTLQIRNDSEVDVVNLFISIEDTDYINLNGNYKLSGYGFFNRNIKYFGKNTIFEIPDINMDVLLQTNRGLHKFQIDLSKVNQNNDFYILKFDLLYSKAGDPKKVYKKHIEIDLAQYNETIDNYNI